MVAVAELLSMKIPSSYEVLFPERNVTGEPRKGETDAQSEYSSQDGLLVVHLFLIFSSLSFIGPCFSIPTFLGKEKPVVSKGPEGGPEWLKQFDAMLPGYSLKNELDILTLLKQVKEELGAFFFFFKKSPLLLNSF